jgi:hypothetical protein
VKILVRQTNLLEVVLATHAGCGFPHFLHRGQQHSNKNGNDGDHHQKFNQGKGIPGFGTHVRILRLD